MKIRIKCSKCNKTQDYPTSMSAYIDRLYEEFLFTCCNCGKESIMVIPSSNVVLV